MGKYQRRKREKGNNKKNGEGWRQIKEEEATRFNFPSSPIKTAKQFG